MNPNEAITIVTTACAIPSCPSTWIIDRVHDSVREHLPTAKHLFLFDGVHAIQEGMREPYAEYRWTLKTRINSGLWSNSEYMEFAEWGHQATMVRIALAQGRIQTPLVLWLESDYAFNEEPIDWQGIVNSLLEGEACYIRFAIPEETRITIKSLNVPMPSRFVPLMKHRNYSGLPHVCRIDFLKRLMLLFKTAKSHLECPATEDIPFSEEQWRLALYTPPGLVRLVSLDGREGHPKPVQEL